MNYLKNLLLSAILLSASFIYCMEQNKENDNINLNIISKKRIDIDYTNIDWGEYFNKLPNEIIEKILDYIFGESNINELIKLDKFEELIKIFEIKKTNKTFFIFISQNYNDQLKKISQILSKKLLEIANPYFPKENLNLAVKIIKSGANLNIQDRDGISVLMIASINNQSEIVKLLIDANANVNLKNRCGATALDVASINGSIDTAKLLIDNGANVNTRNHNGGTAIMFAALYNKPEIVKLLIDSGADISIRDMFGRSALDLAKNFDEIIKLLKNKMGLKQM